MTANESTNESSGATRKNDAGQAAERPTHVRPSASPSRVTPAGSRIRVALPGRVRGRSRFSSVRTSRWRTRERRAGDRRRIARRRTRVVTALVGPNGSGKSTLLKGLADQLARDGTVLLEGRDVHEQGRKNSPGGSACFHRRAPPESITVEELVYHGRYPHRGFSITSPSRTTGRSTVRSNSRGVVISASANSGA